MRKLRGFRLIELLLVIALLVAFATLSGCATTGGKVDPAQFAQWDANNAIFTRAIARQAVRTWGLNGAALTEILARYKTLLPCNCDQDIQTLNGIYAKCVVKDANGDLTCEELTDKDLGQAIVIWASVWGSIVKSGVEQIMQVAAPSLLAKIMPIVSALGL